MSASPTARCGRCCTSGWACCASAARTTRAISRVNARFAARLAPLLQPDDMVWVHDYHLIPLGRMLRERGFQDRIGFFLHVPFVPPSMMRGAAASRAS